MIKKFDKVEDKVHEHKDPNDYIWRSLLINGKQIWQNKSSKKIIHCNPMKFKNPDCFIVCIDTNIIYQTFDPLVNLASLYPQTIFSISPKVLVEKGCKTIGIETFCRKYHYVLSMPNVDIGSLNKLGNSKAVLNDQDIILHAKEKQIENPDKVVFMATEDINMQ